MFFREKRWVALLEYIDMLPTASRFNEALANDPELADELAMRPKPKEPWSPRVSEYDLNATMLAHLLSISQGIQQAIIASAGGRPKAPKPFPAPYTEVDKARKRAEQKFATDIAVLFGFEESDLF